MNPPLGSSDPQTDRGWRAQAPNIHFADIGKGCAAAGGSAGAFGSLRMHQLKVDRSAKTQQAFLFFNLREGLLPLSAGNTLEPIGKVRIGDLLRQLWRSTNGR
jgi:hypothetical protein